MEGFINESHWDYIEEVYPGLREFYEKLETKPKTFLELFARYQRYLTRKEKKEPPIGEQNSKSSPEE
ncbi:MAG: hypothetical protein D6812_00885 [Deltaproteobacteria bacterium]|nr:MAG: hypothetical protein D6812_00885 [Deltaproteobacteria bacterium]